jgi:gluconokinase
LTPAVPVRVVVITGVAGSGKTTVGRALAAHLGWRFHDADDLHSPESIARMRRNQPLDDRQREPWLRRVRALIEEAVEDRAGAVVACSALKARYRATLGQGLPGIRFVHLTGAASLLRRRLEQRAGHFAGAGLLETQLAALEPPEDALTLDVSLPVDALVDAIVADLESNRSQTE